MNHPKSIFTDPGSFNGKRQQQPSLTRAPSPSRQTSSPEYPATLTSASRPRPSAPRKTHSPTHPRSSAHKASPNNVSSAVVPSVEREGEAASDTGVLRERTVSQPQTSAPNRTSPYQARDLANTRHFKTPPSTSRKRSAEEDTPEEASPSTEPLQKRPRLLSLSRHILDQFSFSGPSINTSQPSSPLFFSNSPQHLRPQLPARFSSSEAAARMLSKAKTEEGHVKTVALARGTIHTPTSAPARAASDRSATARSPSPDFMSKQSPSHAILSSVGILELLEQDERPTMIVDLADTNNYGIGPLTAIFANSSLRSYQGLLEVATGLSGTTTPSAAPVRSFVQFKSWLLSAVINGESLDVCLPSFIFAGLTWSCSTLRKRLRILSGAHLIGAASPATRALPIQPHVDASSLPMRSDDLTTPTASAMVTTSEDRLDYFGAAAPPLPAVASRAASSDTMSTSESPGSRRLTLTPGSSRSKVVAKRITPLSSSSLDLVVDGTSSNQTPWSNSTPSSENHDPSFDWTRLPISDSMPRHIQFALSVDWASTALGPIEQWKPDLRQMCNLIMASPHPAAMYWGDDLTAIYNEAYILLAGQKHPKLMGQSYREAWAEIWDNVKEVFASARLTGEATMKDDDCLFIKRNEYLEETYFSWSIIPMVGSDGTVMGLYNPAFEKTRRKIAERRMLTLREIGELTAAARDVRSFWKQAISALEINEYDTPFVLLYSVSDDADSDAASIHSSSPTSTRQCVLEGALGIPAGHSAAPPLIDLRTGTEGFGPVFREAIKAEKPILLEIGTRDLPSTLLEGFEWRGFGDPCRAIVVCPIQPTTGENNFGFLVLGVNPRRPYDEDYSLFVQLLSRQLATSLASVVLFEEEIKRGQKAAKLAALDRIELSEQLAARTQEAIESETKFTRMAEFAPVGMFIASSTGKITYCNDAWFEISQLHREGGTLEDEWMDAVKDEDRALVSSLWHNLVVDKQPITSTFRFKASWVDSDGTVGERWVLWSAYPEKYDDGNLKSVFGSFTDISKQKWAEGFQKRKMEEAVELKRQQENFIDMTSHEMRNPLSAILQSADEVSTTVTQLRDDFAPRNGESTEARIVERLSKSRTTVTDAISSVLEAAQIIALCAQHQKRIVDDILTLSKLDSALLMVTPIDTQPLAVVQRALKMHEGELQSADIQLKFFVDESFKTLKVDWVRLDPSRVLQVLINLTTNAIKFTTTERKRTITVSIAASLERPTSAPKQGVDYFPSKRPERSEMFQEKDWGDGEEVYVHFAVEDTGRGLTEQEKKMLFLRFSQASPRTHVQYGGSGLGLFISRELTELQGGQIGVASEAGKGSTFAFYVKAKRSTEAPPAAAPLSLSKQAGHATATNANASKRGKKPIKVLIVEDNLVNQRVLQKQLKNLGCICYVANHGGEALDRLRRSTYWSDPSDCEGERVSVSVVLMDQEMPVMDGLTCTRKIRELEMEGKLLSHVPVIAVTANARSEQIQTALEIGMDDVVSKPFRIPELIPKIEELMEKYPEPS